MQTTSLFASFFALLSYSVFANCPDPTNKNEFEMVFNENNKFEIHAPGYLVYTMVKTEVYDQSPIELKSAYFLSSQAVKDPSGPFSYIRPNKTMPPWNVPGLVCQYEVGYDHLNEVLLYRKDSDKHHYDLGPGWQATLVHGDVWKYSCVQPERIGDGCTFKEIK